MKEIFSIAVLTFKRAVRDKFFSGIAFFLVFYLLFCAFLGILSVGHTDKVMQNAGLAGIEITAFILIVFSFVFMFYKDKSSRVFDLCLVNFSRFSYISGMIIGYIFLALGYMVFAGISYGIILYVYKAFSWTPFLGLYPVFLMMLIFIFWACFFSCLFRSALITLLSTVFLYSASNLAYPALRITGKYGSSVQNVLMKAVYYLLPNLDKFDLKSLVIQGTCPGLKYFLSLAVYSIVYILFLWFIIVYTFRRKEY